MPTPIQPRPPAAPVLPATTLAEAAKAIPAYFAPEPSRNVNLRELSVLEQMYGYYEAA